MYRSWSLVESDTLSPPTMLSWIAASNMEGTCMAVYCYYNCDYSKYNVSIREVLYFIHAYVNYFDKQYKQARW